MESIGIGLGSAANDKFEDEYHIDLAQLASNHAV